MLQLEDHKHFLGRARILFVHSAKRARHLELLPVVPALLSVAILSQVEVEFGEARVVVAEEVRVVDRCVVVARDLVSERRDQSVFLY